MPATSLNQPLRSRRRVPTILCVDDDLDVLGSIQLRLRKFDVKLFLAFDGLEGFGEALARKPDVIVMDLDMPYGDGISLLDWFRRNAQTEHIPVIVLTGMRDPGLKHKLIHMGANQFMTKPFQFDELLHELSRFIDFHEPEHTNKLLEEHNDDQQENSCGG